MGGAGGGSGSRAYQPGREQRETAQLDGVSTGPSPCAVLRNDIVKRCVVGLRLRPASFAWKAEALPVGFARPVCAAGKKWAGPGKAGPLWSGREDLNLRPQRPKRCALPGCATPRDYSAEMTEQKCTPGAPKIQLCGAAVTIDCDWRRPWRSARPRLQARPLAALVRPLHLRGRQRCTAPRPICANFNFCIDLHSFSHAQGACRP